MKRDFILVLFLAAILLIGVDLWAASIIEVPFDKVVQGSELIFDGKVKSKEVRRLSNGLIYTYFTFEVIEVIKGEYDSVIEIGFEGGQIGDLTLAIPEMRMPEIGERGIYFIETLSEQQINPLYGWQQGHYLVITDPAMSKNLVVPVEGYTLEKHSRALERGIDLEDFKDKITDITKGE